MGTGALFSGKEMGRSVSPNSISSFVLCFRCVTGKSRLLHSFYLSHFSLLKLSLKLCLWASVFVLHSKSISVRRKPSFNGLGLLLFQCVLLGRTTGGGSFDSSFIPLK